MPPAGTMTEVFVLERPVATRNAAVRFASTTSVKDSSDIFSNKPSRVTPALDTTISTGPNASSTAVNAASTESPERTSHCTAKNPSGGGDEL